MEDGGSRNAECRMPNDYYNEESQVSDGRDGETAEIRYEGDCGDSPLGRTSRSVTKRISTTLYRLSGW